MLFRINKMRRPAAVATMAAGRESRMMLRAHVLKTRRMAMITPQILNKQ